MTISRKVLIIVGLIGFAVSTVSTCSQEPKKIAGDVKIELATIKLKKQTNTLKKDSEMLMGGSFDKETLLGILTVGLVVGYFAWPVYAWYNNLPLIPAKSSP